MSLLSVKWRDLIAKSYPGPSIIQFRLKGNNKSKSVSKRVAQCCS